MYIQSSLVLLALSAVAACGGSGGGDSPGVLTTGILTDVEVPSEADIAKLPDEVQSLVETFVEENERFAPTETLPTGSAIYDGGWGFGLEDGDAVVTGSLYLEASFGEFETVNGSVYDLKGDENGRALVIENDLAVNMDIVGTGVEGTANGTILLEDEEYVIQSDMTGLFGGPNAERVIGTTVGTVTGPDDNPEALSGYFVAGAR